MMDDGTAAAGGPLPASIAGEAHVPFTILIPAHNEAATIARTLASMNAANPGDGRQIIVICNGCTDGSAEIARQSCRSAQVLELAEGGKWRAINVGFERAQHETVLVVDADVEISANELNEVARALKSGGAWAASPAVIFDVSGASPWVRSYYNVFSKHYYLRSGVGGAGVYGLSSQGWAAIGPLPPLISDDGYVRVRIPLQRQRRVAVDDFGREVSARVRPPRTLAELLRTEARWRRGDRELASMLREPPRSRRFLLTLLRRREITLRDALRYALIKFAGRFLALAEPIHPERLWRKDPTSRHC